MILSEGAFRRQGRRDRVGRAILSLWAVCRSDLTRYRPAAVYIFVCMERMLYIRLVAAPELPVFVCVSSQLLSHS